MSAEDSGRYSENYFIPDETRPKPYLRLLLALFDRMMMDLNEGSRTDAMNAYLWAIQRGGYFDIYCSFLEINPAKLAYAISVKYAHVPANFRKMVAEQHEGTESAGEHFERYKRRHNAIKLTREEKAERKRVLDRDRYHAKQAKLADG